MHISKRNQAELQQGQPGGRAERGWTGRGMESPTRTRTYPTPHNGGAIVSVPVDGFAGQLGRLAQLLYVNRLRCHAEYGWAQHNYANDGRGPVRAEVVVGRAGVAASIVLVHLGEEQAAVHLVEHPGHVVRVE